MHAIEGSGSIVEEPDWALLMTDPVERAAAAEHWRRITTELRDRDLLAPSNLHMIQRLVMAYIVFDRCSREVSSTGAVLKPKRGNPKAIARMSPYFAVMRQTGSDAASLEAQLGITPQRRSSAGKITKRAARTTGADAFLHRKS